MAKARTRASRNRDDSDENGKWHFYDEDLVANFPLLAAFMFGTRNEFEEEHAGGSLTLFEKGGMLKFRLYDKSTEETGWGGNIDACSVFAGIEEQLQANGIDWQAKKSSSRN